LSIILATTLALMDLISMEEIAPLAMKIARLAGETAQKTAANAKEQTAG